MAEENGAANARSRANALGRDKVACIKHSGRASKPGVSQNGPGIAAADRPFNSHALQATLKGGRCRCRACARARAARRQLCDATGDALKRRDQNCPNAAKRRFEIRRASLRFQALRATTGEPLRCPACLGPDAPPSAKPVLVIRAVGVHDAPSHPDHNSPERAQDANLDVPRPVSPDKQREAVGATSLQQQCKDSGASLQNSARPSATPHRGRCDDLGSEGIPNKPYGASHVQTALTHRPGQLTSTSDPSSRGPGPEGAARRAVVNVCSTACDGMACPCARRRRETTASPRDAASAGERRCGNTPLLVSASAAMPGEYIELDMREGAHRDALAGIAMRPWNAAAGCAAHTMFRFRALCITSRWTTTSPAPQRATIPAAQTSVPAAAEEASAYQPAGAHP